MRRETKVKKALIIILDGMGDRPIAEFKGKTPLEYAKTPLMDQLVSQGICAMVDPLTPGMPVSTHTGMALLMGLPPKDAAYLARGPVEAAGIDLKTQPGDVILRCNFAHIEADKNNFRVLDRRAGRINEGTATLAKAVNKIKLPYGIKGKLYPTTQHRAVLHFSGDNLSAKVSDTDCSEISPAYVQVCKPLINKSAALKTAEVINTFTHQAYQILHDHPINKQRIKQAKVPANGLLCRSAGQISSMHNILNHYKLKVAVISAETTIIGLSKMFDFNSMTRAEFTALTDTDLDKKFALAHEALQNHDIVYVHIKGTDICAHDKQPELKAKFIEKVDQALAASNISIADTIIAVTADHSTDSNTGFHCGDPVPSILYSPYGRRDKCHIYSEQECMSGGLGRLSASSFLLSIVDQMSRLHNFKKEDTSYLEAISLSVKSLSAQHNKFINLS